MEKPQPRREERDDGRGLMDAWSKGRCRTWFVVVFQKAGQLVLVIKPGIKMLAHRPGMTGAQAVVQSFVVGEIESLLLERPLQVPIDLCHKTKLGSLLPHPLGRLRPEGLGGDIPGSLEH